jgi:inorganic pyrophosphatase
VQADVITEVPQGSRNEYEMDSALGRIRLDRRPRYPRQQGQ